MPPLILIFISGAIGAAVGAVIFFAKDEPNKIELTLAYALRNILTGLLIGYTVVMRHLFANPTLRSLLFFGAVYGFLNMLVVYLGQGRSKFATNLPMLVIGTLTGVVTGLAFYLIPDALK